MTTLVFLVVLGLVFYVVWNYLGRTARPKAKLGPHVTNVREPDPVIVHDVLPPSDTSPRYSDAKVAPSPTLGLPDTRRDVELAEDLVPAESDWSGLNDPLPLPARYTEESLTVLVRNPGSLYAYWERSEMSDTNLLATLGEVAYRRSTPSLRVVDVTARPDPGQQIGQTWFIDVGDLDDHWFIQDGVEPDHGYEVSYGRRTADGQYIVLSYAQPVRTPHEAPAPETTTMLYRLYATTEPRVHHAGSQWK